MRGRFVCHLVCLHFLHSEGEDDAIYILLMTVTVPPAAHPGLQFGAALLFRAAGQRLAYLAL